MYFNPRSPRGGATGTHPSPALRSSNDFNPRSPRGGATAAKGWKVGSAPIFQSTLPTRGSDGLAERRHGALQLISIHAPHEGERQCAFGLHAPIRLVFQSTLPTRGSDYNTCPARCSVPHFNPRSPRGGATLSCWLLWSARRPISIHAPHEGERRSSADTTSSSAPFQSTLPTRGSDVW